MNRPANGSQPIRGAPTGFVSAPLTQSRAASAQRLLSKMPANNATWGAFGGVPMGSVGLPGQRQNNGSMTSFAQTIGGTPQAASIDLSEFPSLSNTPQQQSSGSAPSMWSTAGARSIGQSTGQRSGPQSLMSSHQQTQAAQQQTQQQQDDLFASSSQLPNTQAGFRFGQQSAVGQTQPTASDDFPPLSRNLNGEMGQDRNTGLLQSFGNSQQSAPGFVNGSGTQSNALLNALSGSNRVSSSSAQASSTTSIGDPRSPPETTRSIMEPENGSSRSPLQQSRPQPSSSESLSAHSASELLGSTDFRFATRPSQMDETTPEIDDPLSGFNDKDRFGLKGLTAMLGAYPDQAALIGGLDLTAFGFDLGAPERLTSSIWSPYDDTPPRPTVPKFKIPECYSVHNVQPIENKMSSFSDETLMYMFYSNPQDVQQMMAAQELANRNWRYHKKLQTWLTKDEMMVPQPLGEGTERGYYIFFDFKEWVKQRRELVLNYSDLEQTTQPGRLL